MSETLAQLPVHVATCKVCSHRRAKLPKTNPRFCTQKCAVAWAYEMSESDVWAYGDSGYDWYEPVEVEQYREDEAWRVQQLERLGKKK